MYVCVCACVCVCVLGVVGERGRVLRPGVQHLTGTGLDTAGCTAHTLVSRDPLGSD